MLSLIPNIINKDMNSINNSDALVVFSGGQDTTTCLFWALKHFQNVSALTYTYGQKHVKEVDAAKAIAQKAGVPWQSIDLSFISRLSHNALTDPSIIMDHAQTGLTSPNTFVPGRNLFFFAVAAVVAREHNINHIVVGVSQTDFSGYPDCRDAFIKSLNVTLNLAMDYQFIFHTPLMWLDKCETWALADQLGIFDIVRNETLTCYNGIPGDGCGHCPACKLRNEGLQKYLKQKHHD